ncbi:MAG: hypothetical protein GEU80_13060 [Dehalococcoidia bacterium]|nr:hypothetical protein [Dehalococcoidia bacterium]
MRYPPHPVLEDELALAATTMRMGGGRRTMLPGESAQVCLEAAVHEREFPGKSRGRAVVVDAALPGCRAVAGF